MKEFKTIELEKARAVFLGWEERLTRQVKISPEAVIKGGLAAAPYFSTEEYDNPETYQEFVKRKWQEHQDYFDDAFIKHLEEKKFEEKTEGIRESARAEIEAVILPTNEELI